MRNAIFKYIVMRLLLILVFVLSATNVNSQDVEAELRNQLIDASTKSKVEIYSELAQYYYKSTGKGDSMIAFGNRIIKLSSHENGLKHQITGYRLIGEGNFINRQFDTAEIHLKKAFELAKTDNNQEELVKIHNRLGGVYQNKDRLPKSISHFLQAIKLAESISDDKTLASACYGISVIYALQKQTEKQIEYLVKSTKACDTKESIPPFTKNVIYGSASQQYSILGSKPEFKNYTDSSIVYAKKALRISKENQLNQRIPSDLIVLSSLHANKKQSSKALEYAQDALNYLEFMKEDTKLNVFMTLSYINRAEGNKEVSYVFLDSLDNLPIKERPHYGTIIEKFKYNSYKYFKDFDQSFKAMDNYFELESKKKAIEQNKTINELETRYKTELKDKEIKRLWVLLIIALSVILLGGFIFKWIQLKRSKAKNIALKEAIKQQLKLERELVNVRNNIAQDFHDDLGNKLARISFLTRLVEDELSNENEGVKAKVNQVKEDTVSLYVGTKDFIFSLKPNSDYLEEVVTYLSDFGEDYFDQTDIKFVLDKNISLNKKLPHYWSKQLIYIFKEAMTNAFKHSKCTVLTLKFKQVEDELYIECSDNGVGISEAHLNSKNGLRHMKSRAEKIGGRLEIQTSKENGTSIIFKGKTNKTI